MDTIDRFRKLFGLHTAGIISPSERAEFLNMLTQAEHDEELRQLMAAAWAREADQHLSDQEAAAMLQRILYGKPAVIPLYKRMAFRVSAAAAVLLLIAGTYWVWTKQEVSRAPLAITRTYKGDVAPGRSGALLTLANGQQVLLDTVADGSLVLEGGIRANKQGGQISYAAVSNTAIYHTVSTDKGRQWSLVLPDGSKVWLNAASSIRYSLQTNGKERLVELSGEAYFDVVHNVRQPFRVKAGNRVFEDVGTQFNMNAYGDEASLKATVVEGSVKVSTVRQSALLVADQQASIAAGSEQIQVSAVHAADAASWKNGFFSFSHDNLSMVMRQLSRWYNVEIDYQYGAADQASFTGSIDRNLSLAQVLKLLEQAHAHFKIVEDKKIVIMP
jgi:ferric-dicitrate binding protein FerR (iron transport regulator)